MNQQQLLYPAETTRLHQICTSQQKQQEAARIPREVLCHISLHKVRTREDQQSGAERPPRKLHCADAEEAAGPFSVSLSPSSRHSFFRVLTAL